MQTTEQEREPEQGTQAPRSVGTGTKLAYGVGSMAFAAKDAAVVNFVPFFYTQVAGLSGSLYGAAAFVGQLSDAVSDPVLGTVSDNHRSRWGRRHPFMLGSILPLAFCFLWLFAPPTGLGQWGLFLWLAGALVALRTCLTVFAVPHAALGAELSTDYEERSLIVSYRTTLGWLAGVALPTFALFFLFSKGTDGTDGRLVASNYINYATLSALIVVVAILVTVWFTRREIPHLPVPATRRKLRILDPLRDVMGALQNRNFRWIFVAMLFLGASTGVSVTLGFYANTYFWEFSSAQIGIITVSSVVPTAVAFALLRPLGKLFEKKAIFIGSMVVLVVNGLWFIPGRLLGLLPENGAPLLLGLALLHQFVLVCSVVLIQTVGPSMIADIVDEHTVDTGERNDGVFFAAQGFALKIPTGLGQAVGGILIDVVGLQSGVAPGAVPGGTLFNLGLVAGPLVALSFLVPIAFLTRFHLDRQRHAELRDILVARGEAGPHA